MHTHTLAEKKTGSFYSKLFSQIVHSQGTSMAVIIFREELACSSRAFQAFFHPLTSSQGTLWISWPKAFYLEIKAKEYLSGFTIK
jgi:hypothetical protein